MGPLLARGRCRPHGQVLVHHCCHMSRTQRRKRCAPELGHCRAGRRLQPGIVSVGADGHCAGTRTTSQMRINGASAALLSVGAAQGDSTGSSVHVRPTATSKCQRQNPVRAALMRTGLVGRLRRCSLLRCWARGGASVCVSSECAPLDARLHGGCQSRALLSGGASSQSASHGDHALRPGWRSLDLTTGPAIARASAPAARGPLHAPGQAHALCAHHNMHSQGSSGILDIPSQWLGMDPAPNTSIKRAQFSCMLQKQPRSPPESTHPSSQPRCHRLHGRP